MVKVEWKERGVCWKYSSSVSGEEVIKASVAIYADKRFDELRYKLCDFLEADSISMTARDTSKLVCQHAAAAQTNPDIKIAVVGKKIDFPSLSLLVEHFSSYESEFSWPVALFEGLVAAHEWLAT